jgi:chromate reductase
VRVGWKPAEGVVQRDAGECADLARASFDEARHRRDRAIALFNQDLEADSSPAQWTAFRQRVKAADAVLFVTPEYNRSMPAVLKNALDVGSRPYGSSVWDRKPGAVVSGSPGAVGAFGANHHLRQSLVFLNVPTMQQPEAYVGHVDKLFDEHGKLVSDGTRKFLQEFMQAFAKWVETIRS